MVLEAVHDQQPKLIVDKLTRLFSFLILIPNRDRLFGDFVIPITQTFAYAYNRTNGQWLHLYLAYEGNAFCCSFYFAGCMDAGGTCN